MNRKTFLLSLLFAGTQFKLRGKSLPKNKGHVLVLGGGMSGLAAAKELSQNGYSVEVIEARNRLGGRIHTNLDWGYPLELGASYIHGVQKNPLVELSKKANSPLFLPPEENVEFWSQGKSLRRPMIRKMEEKVADLISSLESKSDSYSDTLSFSDLLRKENPNLKGIEQDLYDWMVLTTEAAVAFDLENLSAKTHLEEGETFSGPDMVFLNGYASLLPYLSNGLKLHLGEEVNLVKQTQSGVRFQSKNKSWEGDFAVISIPLGVLQKGKVSFEPGLSLAKKNSLSRLKMGLLNKLYLEWDEPFWNPELGTIGTRQEKRDFRYTISLLPLYKKPTLLSFVAGKFAKECESFSKKELETMFLSRLEAELGKKIPKPKRILYTRWSEDPYAYGSYAAFAIGSTGNDMDTLGARENRLFFCGEHTSRAHYGYVHGAYLSGLRVAKEIQE